MNPQGKSMWYPLHQAAKRWNAMHQFAKVIYENALSNAKMDNKDGSYGPRDRDGEGILMRPTEDEIPAWNYSDGDVEVDEDESEEEVV